MINQLISQIKQEQDKLARATMERPSTHDNNMLRVGQWQGMEQTLRLIEELLIEPEDK